VAAALVRHTRLANLTGHPAVSLPVPVPVPGRADGPAVALPVGLQLTAATDIRLLECATAAEAAFRAANGSRS
jgi:Asp-tRNA(Asn)/Glu-tRNA(Gln) amidotransferase A subunit family amidase